MGEMGPEEKKEFYRRFENLERQNIRILNILESDDRIKEKGLVEKVNQMHIDLHELLTRERVYKAKATTWGVIGGAVGTALLWLIKLVLGKLMII